MTAINPVTYYVREPGKFPGLPTQHASDAVNMALDWYDDTGIACEIWVSSLNERGEQITYQLPDEVMCKRPRT